MTRDSAGWVGRAGEGRGLLERLGLAAKDGRRTPRAARRAEAERAGRRRTVARVSPGLELLYRDLRGVPVSVTDLLSAWGYDARRLLDALPWVPRRGVRSEAGRKHGATARSRSQELPREHEGATPMVSTSGARSGDERVVEALLRVLERTRAVANRPMIALRAARRAPGKAPRGTESSAGEKSVPHPRAARQRPCQGLGWGSVNTERSVGDREGIEVAFCRALRRIRMAYQPIICWSSRSVFALEALVRSTEPSLPSPQRLFDAAEQLGRIRDLSCAIRAAIGQTAGTIPESLLLFVNLHPSDLEDPALCAADSPLIRHANRVVFELTERTNLADVPDARAVIDELRSLGYRIAIDDLGAGYASLSSFATLEPEFVKLDLSLVRGINRNPLKKRLVHSLLVMCRQAGVEVVAEGVETRQERDALLEQGCDFLQGYLFARPGTHFPIVVAW